MLFQTHDAYIDVVNPEDIADLVAIYNSHRHFCTHHLGRHTVTAPWMKDEIRTVKDDGFVPLKIVEKSTQHVIGLLDVKIDRETYLSLLMIHEQCQGRGFGQSVYHSLEAYLRMHQGQSIRIDVATEYDARVMNFWRKDQFQALHQVTLTWHGASFAALTMTKIL